MLDVRQVSARRACRAGFQAAAEGCFGPHGGGINLPARTRMTMLFPVSKIFWLLFAPSHILLWCALAAALLLLAHRGRPAAVFAGITAIGFIILGVLPTGRLLMRPLEDRYPERSLPGGVTGILTLGGGSDEDIRLIRVWALARAYPGAKIVYSGGSGLLLPGAPGHAAKHAAMTFADLGLPLHRLTLEDQSRNTWENIVFSRRLLKPKPDEVWV